MSSSCSPRGPRLPFRTQLIRGSLFGFWVICEQLDYNLLFRWLLDMDAAEPSFDHSSFSRNRARLLEHDVAREFFTRVVAQARDCSCFRTNTSPWMARWSRPGRLCSAKILRQSCSASEEAVLVVKSVENGVRHNWAGSVETMPLALQGHG